MGFFGHYYTSVFLSCKASQVHETEAYGYQWSLHYTWAWIVCTTSESIRRMSPYITSTPLSRTQRSFGSGRKKGGNEGWRNCRYYSRICCCCEREAACVLLIFSLTLLSTLFLHFALFLPLHVFLAFFFFSFPFLSSLAVI